MQINDSDKEFLFQLDLANNLQFISDYSLYKDDKSGQSRRPQNANKRNSFHLDID